MTNTIALVVAAAENDVIGRTGTMLPWNLPDDLAHFREITRGRPIIMGRKTYESIGRPLPKRRNIVVSRQPGLAIEGCDIAASLEEALRLAQADGPGEIFVIGGGQIFEQALTKASRIYLTRVHAQVPGDAYFRFDAAEWHEDSREYHPKDEHNDYAFTFINLSRNLLH